jgi:hypothetical protein
VVPTRSATYETTDPSANAPRTISVIRYHPANLNVMGTAIVLRDVRLVSTASAKIPAMGSVGLAQTANSEG